MRKDKAESILDLESDENPAFDADLNYIPKQKVIMHYPHLILYSASIRWYESPSPTHTQTNIHTHNLLRYICHSTVLFFIFIKSYPMCASTVVQATKVSIFVCDHEICRQSTKCKVPMDCAFR